jgi:lipoprotein-anchoring transpeptidase ErfK/SrfK
MIPTRVFAAGLAAILSIATMPPVQAAAQQVTFDTDARPGTVVVQTGERRLYLILPHGMALRYVVGVGRDGRQWAGTSTISAKFVWPNWAPPAAIRKDKPSLPALIAGGDAANPMGAAAMTLTGTDYAIHGTNAPDSIGGFVSYGCIRMHNDDVADLFARVRVGTVVVVTR